MKQTNKVELVVACIYLAYIFYLTRLPQFPSRPFLPAFFIMGTMQLLLLFFYLCNLVHLFRHKEDFLFRKIFLIFSSLFWILKIVYIQLPAPSLKLAIYISATILASWYLLYTGYRNIFAIKIFRRFK